MNQPAEITTRPNESVSVPLKTTDLLKRATLIKQVQEALMKSEVHYGKLPGCPKPTLFKPGAEKLCLAFKLAPEYIETDLSTEDEIRYRVKTRLTSQDTGAFIGEGAGECSSKEEKYNWRRVICEKEFEEASPDMRKEKWVKGYQGSAPRKIKMIRTNPADIANTVLKMACKRSLVHAVLTNTGASDIFTQDLEDLEEATRDHLLAEEEQPRGKPVVEMPKARTSPSKPTKATKEVKTEDEPTNGNKTVSEQQLKAIQSAANSAGFPEPEICKHFKIKTLEELKAGDISKAIQLITKYDGPE